MKKQRLQELAGITDAPLLTEGEKPSTKIGDMDIKIVGVGRDQFGGNDTANIEVNGKVYRAFKQGMIQIWAWSLRDKMSNEDQLAFDKWMDKNYSEMVKGK